MVNTERSSSNPPPFKKMMESISLQSAQLLEQGEKPRVLEVGARQDAALRQGGVHTDSLVTSASVGPGPSFRHIGEPFQATKIERVELQIVRINREDWLQVKASDS